MPDGNVVPPTNKKFHIDFYTVARWNKQGEIAEENLFYDLMGMLNQIGVLPSEQEKKGCGSHGKPRTKNNSGLRWIPS